MSALFRPKYTAADGTQGLADVVDPLLAARPHAQALTWCPSAAPVERHSRTTRRALARKMAGRQMTPRVRLPADFP